MGWEGALRGEEREPPRSEAASLGTLGMGTSISLQAVSWPPRAAGRPLREAGCWARWALPSGLAQQGTSHVPVSPDPPTPRTISSGSTPRPQKSVPPLVAPRCFQKAPYSVGEKGGGGRGGALMKMLVVSKGKAQGCHEVSRAKHKAGFPVQPGQLQPCGMQTVPGGGHSQPPSPPPSYRHSLLSSTSRVPGAARCPRFPPSPSPKSPLTHS